MLSKILAVITVLVIFIASTCIIMSLTISMDTTVLNEYLGVKPNKYSTRVMVYDHTERIEELEKKVKETLESKTDWERSVTITGKGGNTISYALNLIDVFKVQTDRNGNTRIQYVIKSTGVRETDLLTKPHAATIQELGFTHREVECPKSLKKEE